MAGTLEENKFDETHYQQVDLNNLSSQMKQPIPREENSITNLSRHTTTESVIDGIPCEYCDMQININDLASHSKQCAVAYKEQIEKLANGTPDKTIIELIPCEYCDVQIALNDLESHSKDCTNNPSNNRNRRINDEHEPNNILIPCEYCGIPVQITELMSHTQECMEVEQQRINNIVREFEDIPLANLIPCDLCKESFPFQEFAAHQVECQRKQNSIDFTPNALTDVNLGGIFVLPKHWDQSSPNNLSRYILQPDTAEYKFVVDNFHKTLSSHDIVQIERIQNRRWYRQYDAHREDFIERYGQSTEQWLFHGCKSQAVEGIISDCFNRSHAVRYASGQGIYFATAASTSFHYTQPDSDNLRHMFMARVLVGKTAPGNQNTRVCPPGFDTTGGGNVFVTYHDAQAYGEYLITFR